MNSADEFTRRLLAEADIRPGQRVLDIGCGTGAVTSMIAERVGASGEVIGVDQNGDALEIARARLAEGGLASVRFIQGDLNRLPDEIGKFDAIVGRRVLMYVPDTVTTLRSLLDALRPGGQIVLQEHDGTATPIHCTALPLHERIHRLIFETVRREGADVQMGFHLSPALEAAGFSVSHLQCQATVLSPTIGHPIEAIVGAMLPRMIEQGVAAEGEFEVSGLDLRLAEERRAANATLLWELVFGVRAHC